MLLSRSKTSGEFLTFGLGVVIITRKLNVIFCPDGLLGHRYSNGHHLILGPDASPLPFCFAKRSSRGSA